MAKRIVIVLILLFSCIGVSIYSGRFVDEITNTICTEIENSIVALEENNYPELREHVGKLSDFYNQHEDQLFHFARRELVIELGISISKTMSLLETQAFSDLNAELASIRWQLRHMQHIEQFQLSNIF